MKEAKRVVIGGSGGFIRHPGRRWNPDPLHAFDRVPD